MCGVLLVTNCRHYNYSDCIVELFEVVFNIQYRRFNLYTLDLIYRAYDIQNILTKAIEKTLQYFFNFL